MSAPILWIVLPLLVAGFLALIRSERWVAILGGTFTLVLCLLAQFIPIGQAVGEGALSFNIAPSLNLLGRQLNITPQDQPLFVLVYGMVTFWFFGTLVTGSTRRLVPLGLAITALLLAALSVEPFLYAALLIEMAVLLAVPLLAPENHPPAPGVIRFLKYQTLAMPLILLAGFLLSGVEASPGDISLVQQSGLLLAIGFALLLPVFPFSTWIPMISNEDCEPYSVGFVLSIFPTIAMLFGLGFLERYSWLRESDILAQVLYFGGLVMVVSGGIWVAFSQHTGRIMGFAITIQIGYSLLALTIADRSTGLNLVLLMIIPRTLALGVWTMASTILLREAGSFGLEKIKGKMRQYPLAGSAITLAAFSLVGIPLLAGFPIQQSLWERVGVYSPTGVYWVLVGMVGLMIGAVRLLTTLVMATEDTPWEMHENWGERIFIGLGIAGLLILGLFPQWIEPLLTNLSQIFQQLGQ